VQFLFGDYALDIDRTELKRRAELVPTGPEGFRPAGLSGAEPGARGQPHQRCPQGVERQFVAEAPDRLWVADITYTPTWAGFLYLAVVDAFTRRLAGWSMANHLRTELPPALADVFSARAIPLFSGLQNSIL
jgi:transposase InsO family protein